MLKLAPVKPRQFLSPLFSKKSIQAEMFARFESELEWLMELDQSESEEYQKNRVKDFLSNTFGYEINTKGKIDLAIFGEKGVEVIMEFKSLANTAEMITQDALHKKAFAEAIKYFFDERAGAITPSNTSSSLRPLSGMCLMPRSSSGFFGRRGRFERFTTLTSILIHLFPKPTMCMRS